jgi:hypothetical protein
MRPGQIVTTVLETAFASRAGFFVGYEASPNDPVFPFDS